MQSNGMFMKFTFKLHDGNVKNCEVQWNIITKTIATKLKISYLL